MSILLYETGYLITLDDESPLSKETFQKSKKIYEFEVQFEATNGRTPTVEETSRELDLKPAKVRDLRSLYVYKTIGTCDLTPSQTATLHNIGEQDPLKCPEAYLLLQEQSQELQAAFGQLPQRDAKIIFMKDIEGIPLWKIGKLLRISGSRASQLRKRALGRMKKHLLEPSQQQIKVSAKSGKDEMIAQKSAYIAN